MFLNLSKPHGSGAWLCDSRIHEELQFRCPAILRASDNLAQRIIVSRWAGRSAAPEEHRADIADAYHTIGISMVQSRLRLAVSNNIVYEGTVEPGTVQLSNPGQPFSLQTSGSYDWIHLYVGNRLLQSCQAILQPRLGNAPLIVKQELPFRDPVIHDLINGFVNMSESCSQTSTLCGESILLAIVTRIVGRHTQSYTSDVLAPRANALIAWRLKRVKEFVADHLAEPITLADMGQAAGLTRMHFAAQFRAATGCRPHEYVLQQRILRARELLLNSNMKLVEIALAVGFQTQAHFTTVFRRIALATPYQWRCRELAARYPSGSASTVRDSIFAGACARPSRVLRQEVAPRQDFRICATAEM